MQSPPNSANPDRPQQLALGVLRDFRRTWPQLALTDVLAKSEKQVAQYRGGKVGVLGYFVGQVMKATRGQANPKLVNQLLRRALDG